MKTGVREGHTETLQSWRWTFGHFCEKKGQITRISHQAVPFPLPFTMLIPSIYCKPKTNHASVTAFFPALLALCLFFIWVLIGSSSYFPFFSLAVAITLILVLSTFSVHDLITVASKSKRKKSWIHSESHTTTEVYVSCNNLAFTIYIKIALQ